MVRVTGLNIYPVKSCRGIALEDTELTETGLKHDRQWVVVDKEHRFLTQRVLPKMALIHTALSASSLVLTSADRPDLNVPLYQSNASVAVRVWNDVCRGFDSGNEAADWLSSFLGQQVRLVRFDPTFQRFSDKKYVGDLPARNAFSDGFPILLISQASLDDLNEKLEQPLPMNRFRPNIVVDGISPFEEDHVAKFLAPGLSLKPVKPCTRCAITTTDQDTARRGVEPLLTLARYRHDEQLDGLVFGQNVVIAEGIGQRLRLGDELTVEWNF